jgi:SPX domain protein involved in polyphosphate accumulation
MKKIIKLTESDLTNLIKRVVKENKYGEEQFSEKIDELNVELHNYYKYSQNFINEITNKLNLLTDEITNSNLSNDDKEVLYNDLDDYEDGYLYPLSRVLGKINMGLFGEEDY